jgi:hypothetical protein
MVELIGMPLVNSLKQQPSVVLVQDGDFLWLRPKLATPVILLTKETSIATDGDGAGNRTAMLSSNSGKFDSVVLVAHTREPICAPASNRPWHPTTIQRGQV